MTYVYYITGIATNSFIVYCWYFIQNTTVNSMCVFVCIYMNLYINFVYMYEFFWYTCTCISIYAYVFAFVFLYVYICVGLCVYHVYV